MTNQTNKSFILHKDSLSILDQLTDEQAGKLFKTIYSYQKTGKIGNLDQITKIIITPFLNQFKRDEESYNNSIIQGKIGNLKKYHNDIYLRLINGDLTLEEAENLAYPHKKVIYRPPIIPDQEGSLNDNKNDSDSDSKNKNDKEKELKENFEKIYRSFNKGKNIKVIPFDKLRTKFRNCLKEITFEELEANVNDYLSYLEIATWRKKKAFDSWINSSECFANDWKTEKNLELNKESAPDNSNICQSINKIIGNNWIVKIEAQEEKAIISISQENWQKMKGLDENIKKQISKKLSDELKTISIKQKYID